MAKYGSKTYQYLTLLFVLALTSCDSFTEKAGHKKKQVVDSLRMDENLSQLLDTTGLKLGELQLPQGFAIDLYARVPNARSMAISPSGMVFIGNRDEKNVYAIEDTNGDFQADKIHIVARDMRMPNGVAFKDGHLYVAEVSKIWKFENIEKNLYSPDKKLIYDQYPTDGHHGWKYIAFGPDGKLYVPVGAPCNICESKREVFSSITRMNPDGSDMEIYARGIRNCVGLTWHPESGHLYFTDNGRDMMGDEFPPDELNRATEVGQHFGYPYCHAGRITDPEFGEKRNCEEFVPPVQTLGPHVAALGMKFYTGEMFPEQYKDQVFIAEHGSWNRSSEAGHTGYRITHVKLGDDGSGQSYEPFITGFLDKASNKKWGRPVDILFMTDGSMLISDDLAGAIYRVTYQSS